MADARRALDWEAQFACALDPDTARAIRDSRKPEDDHSDTCSMCGKFCAVRSMNKALSGSTSTFCNPCLHAKRKARSPSLCFERAAGSFSQGPAYSWKLGK